MSKVLAALFLALAWLSCAPAEPGLGYVDRP